MTLELNFLHVHSPHMGYGRMGHNIAQELKAQGVTVYDHLPGTEDPNVKVAGNAKVFLEGAREGKSNIVCWASAPSHAAGWWKGQTACLLTMWEASRMPEGFRDMLDNFDTVMVPSQQNVELFSRYHPNVKYVPLGVDPDIWQYRPRSKPDRFFRYLIGGRGKRKGTDLAVKAFTKLWGHDKSWGSGPEPRLLMKNPRQEEFFRSDGRIEMISGRISQAEEVELYASAHCYLQPSRGEGFGLQPLQAIAQGCPTVLTDAHGHASFSHLGWPLTYTHSPSDYFIYGDAGDWWEPSLDDLCDHMKWIYENYDQATAIAAQNSAEALGEFTWANTTTKFLDAIGRDRMGPYEGPDEWVEPQVRKYPLVTTRNMTCEIGGYAYQFLAGVEYWQLADVKRVLFEAGDLDPKCLNDEDPKNSGLHDSQIKKLALEQSGDELCPTCGGRW